ncbi:MAG: hypothetical protein MAG453_00191 [Calditrichaeota bacterium]|nr:hypothetical protein [Calditrichota bacterium]
MTDLTVTVDDILAARERVRPHVHRTPVHTSRLLDELAGALREPKVNSDASLPRRR